MTLINMKMLHNRLASKYSSFYNLCSKAESTLKMGEILKRRRIFSMEDVVEYSKVSHDKNLLHLDTEFAQNAGFQDRLVHGMLVASLFPHIISSHFPGAVYVSQSLHFRQPIYVGDEVIGEVQAMDIRAFKNKYLVKFSTKCLKHDSRLAIEGEATAVLPTLVLPISYYPSW